MNLRSSSTRSRSEVASSSESPLMMWRQGMFLATEGMLKEASPHTQGCFLQDQGEVLRIAS